MDGVGRTRLCSRGPARRGRQGGNRARFSTAPGRDATTALRGAGFRFNKLLQHWEGLARFDEAETLAAAYGGTMRRVATVEPPVPLRAADWP